MSNIKKNTVKSFSFENIEINASFSYLTDIPGTQAGLAITQVDSCHI